jgi:hypothetical protein
VLLPSRFCILISTRSNFAGKYRMDHLTIIYFALAKDVAFEKGHSPLICYVLASSAKLPS